MANFYNALKKLASINHLRCINCQLRQIVIWGTTYTKVLNSTKFQVQAFDHWSPDTRQDSWFTASSLHAVLETLNPRPESIIIISDNGGYYHNADLMMILRYWPDWYGIWPKKWVFLEPGEAKTTIDSHHAQVCSNISIQTTWKITYFILKQIAHTINRHIKLGMDISSGKDIEDAISEICRTSVSHLESNRNKGM